MPDDIDDTHDCSVSKGKNGCLNDNLQQLIHYVKVKAMQEPEDAVADFTHTEKACRLLFSRFLAAQKSDKFSKDALANFLDVVSSAESYRLSIAQQAETALTVWHPYYLKEDPRQALSDKEAQELKAIVDHRDDWRIVYMKIVKKTVSLDLYYHFVSRPWFLSDFMVRLLEYNPSTFKPVDGHEPSPRNFIQSLSKHEKEMIKETCDKSLQFAHDSYEWLYKNHPIGILNGLYSREFRETRKPPTDLRRLENLLHYYLKYISGIYNTITTIFPHETIQYQSSP